MATRCAYDSKNPARVPVEPGIDFTMYELRFGALTTPKDHHTKNEENIVITQSRNHQQTNPVKKHPNYVRCRSLHYGLAVGEFLLSPLCVAASLREIKIFSAASLREKKHHPLSLTPLRACVRWGSNPEQ